MHIHIIAAGEKLPKWVSLAYHEYAQRFPKEYKIHLTEIPNSPSMLKLEQAYVSGIPQHSHVIALDVNCKLWNNQQLCCQLEKWRQTFPIVSFLMGPADGLPEAVLARTHERWSLSPLVFPHALARVILIEQLWRSASMLMGHPYHRGS